MIKKTITYTDYNDHERTEDFYFNFSKSELIELQTSKLGGLDVALKKIIAAENTPEVVKTIKEIILKAYGERSDDGRRFIKSEELSTAFSQTEAYSNLFMELATDDKATAEFFNGLIPKELAEQLKDVEI